MSDKKNKIDQRMAESFGVSVERLTEFYTRIEKLEKVLMERVHDSGISPDEVVQATRAELQPKGDNELFFAGYLSSQLTLYLKETVSKHRVVHMLEHALGIADCGNDEDDEEKSDTKSESEPQKEQNEQPVN